MELQKSALGNAQKPCIFYPYPVKLTIQTGHYNFPLYISILLLQPASVFDPSVSNSDLDLLLLVAGSYHKV